MDARAFFEAHAQSGVSLTKFATERGVTHSKAYVWKKKLCSTGGGPVAGFAAVRVNGRQSVGASHESVIEIELENGRIVRVRGDVGETMLGRVLTIAEGAR